MKIILLKNHNGSKAGSEHDVSPEAANYLVRVKVAEYTDGAITHPVQVKPKAIVKPKAPEKPKQTKQVKPKLETK